MQNKFEVNVKNIRIIKSIKNLYKILLDLFFIIIYINWNYILL